MALCKVSSYLLFSLLIAYTDSNLNDYSDINRKAKNKLLSVKEPVKLRRISKHYIEDLINCTGNALFKKQQQIYYTKAENIYGLFYGWQSALRHDFDQEKFWKTLEKNLKTHNHFTPKEIKRFSNYKNKLEFGKALYRQYKKMTWMLTKVENK